MVEREPGRDDGEAAIRIRQGRHVTAVPARVRQTLLRRGLARGVEHGRGHVDPGGVAHVRREGASDEAAAAGDVEHRVARFRDPSRRQRWASSKASSCGDRRGGVEDCRPAGRTDRRSDPDGRYRSCLSLQSRPSPGADKVTAPSARHSARSSLQRVFPSAIQRAGAAPCGAHLRNRARPRVQPFEELHHQEFGFAGHSPLPFDIIQPSTELDIARLRRNACPIYRYQNYHMN